MSKHIWEERIREIASAIIEKNDLEFVHSEVVGSKKNLTIRIFIDKPEGVTHEDCSLISSQVMNILDAEDFFADDYILEVSSPGLERELYSLKDFEKYVGNLAKVKITQPIDGQKNFRGKISGVEDGEIIFDDKTSGKVRFSYDLVAKANLEIDLEKELKGS